MSESGNIFDGLLSSGAVAYETTASRRLADYQGHREDLLTALHGLDALEAVKDIKGPADALGSATDALWTGIIISYVRCFNHGRANRLEAEAIFENTKGGLQYHQHIFSLRNQHFAHDVNSLRRTQTVLDVPHEGEALNVKVLSIRGNHDPTMAEQLRRMIQHVLSSVDELFDRLHGEVTAEANSMDQVTREALPPFSYTVPATTGGEYPPRKRQPK